MDITAAGLICSTNNTEMTSTFWELNGSWAHMCRHKSHLSYGFPMTLSRRSPLSTFGSTKKKVKKQQQSLILVRAESMSSSSVGCELLLEKELQFKPSFEEYLKAMESVQTERAKKNKKMTTTATTNRTTRSSKHYIPNKGGGKSGHFEEGRGSDGGIDWEENDMGDVDEVEFVDKKENGYRSNSGKWDNGVGFRSDKHSGNGRREKEKGRSRAVKEKGNLTGESKVFGKSGENMRWKENQGNNNDNNNNHCEKEKDHRFKVDSYRSKGTKWILRHGKIPVENVLHHRRRNKLEAEDADGEELGFERAAFKPILENEFNDIVDKPRLSRNEMEERIQKLARCLNGADVNMPEWMFSKMIRSARLRFSDYSMLRIIQILGKLGNWRRVLQLIDWLESRERYESHKLRYIYTTALGVLGKARRPVEAMNLFRTMQQQMSTYPDLVAYRSIAVTLGQAGYMRELFEVIDIMKSPPKKKFKIGVLEKWDPRLEPDIIVFNAVLNACVRRKQWEGAFWVLQQLKEKGQQPSGTTYGLAMEVMLACGKYNLVHEFFKKVLRSSIPNALTYKVLVNALWREGKADEAVLAVEDMERRGVVGSAALYYDLSRCLCSAGRCREALLQIDKICNVANKPLVVTYTGLIQACLDARNIEDGVYIFKHMQKFCFPNLVTCNIMLKAYIEHGKFEEANRLFNKLLEGGNHISSKADYKDNVIPDAYSFNTMLDACAVEQRWDEFEVAYKEMLKYGYPYNPKRHLRMILDACRTGKGELLETTWNHLIQNGQIPSPPLMKEMFCMKLEQGDRVAALSCISNRYQGDLQAFSRNAWLHFFDKYAHRFPNDSLVNLVHEVSLLVSKGEEPQPLILQNLVSASREFLRTHASEFDAECVDTQALLC